MRCAEGGFHGAKAQITESKNVPGIASIDSRYSYNSF